MQRKASWADEEQIISHSKNRQTDRQEAFHWSSRGNKENGNFINHSLQLLTQRRTRLKIRNNKKKIISGCHQISDKKRPILYHAWNQQRIGVPKSVSSMRKQARNYHQALSSISFRGLWETYRALRYLKCSPHPSIQHLTLPQTSPSIHILSIVPSFQFANIASYTSYHQMHMRNWRNVCSRACLFLCTYNKLPSKSPIT